MDKPLDELIRDYQESGDYAGLFDEVYRRAQGGDSDPPWAHMQATPDLVRWADEIRLAGGRQRAVVVGCGMGDDAEYLSERGFDVVAFDVSTAAIEICQRRFPSSRVSYRQADLFELPQAWRRAFDFVLENRTIQALPSAIGEDSIGAIAELVAAAGTLLVLCNGRNPDQAKDMIPWPLSRDELRRFVELGLTENRFDDMGVGTERHFLVQYRR